MNDAQVSVDNRTHLLPQPFMVIATQNPWEYHGTFPLPESQLDRFLMRIRIGYPDSIDEKKILERPQQLRPADELEPVLTVQEVLDLQERVEKIRVEDSLMDYLLAIVLATRRCDALALGVSTRGAMALHKASKALALVRQRDYCLPDDIKELAPLVLSHRVRLEAKHGLQSHRSEDMERLIQDIVESVPVPLIGRHMPKHHAHAAIRVEPPERAVTKRTALSLWPGIFLRWFYQNRSLRLTSEGLRFVLIALAVGIAALNTGNNLLYLLLAMMLALIVVSGVLSERCLKGLSIQRRLPAHLFAGEPATVALRVTNEKRHFPSFSLRISDVVVGAAQFAATHLLYLPPKGSTVHSYRLLFPKRGQFRVEATKVSTRFPFGLFVKIATLPNQAEMVAYPAPKPLPQAILDALETIGHDRAASRRGPGSGLYNLRDYHVGDDSRSVHWKTSARQSRLVVRETEAEDQRQVTLALASQAPVGMRALTLTATQDFERAIILTASLAAHFQRQGFAHASRYRG